MDTLPGESVSPTPQAMESTTNPPTPSMVEGGTTNPPTPASVMQVEPCVEPGGLSKAESTTMLCEPDGLEHGGGVTNPHMESELTVADLELVCDLFYLPSEHGLGAMDILTEFYWLKTNAGGMLTGASQATAQSSSETSVSVEVGKPEWVRRRAAFYQRALNIKRAFEKICIAPNRELVYNLYTYLWDMVGVVFMLLSYVDWLTLGKFSPNYQQLIIGRHTWFSGIREAFQSGDHEPWVFRGGLTADLQRLMPVDSGNDLFLYQYPDTPAWWGRSRLDPSSPSTLVSVSYSRTTSGMLWAIFLLLQIYMNSISE